MEELESEEKPKGPAPSRQLDEDEQRELVQRLYEDQRRKLEEREIARMEILSTPTQPTPPKQMAPSDIADSVKRLWDTSPKMNKLQTLKTKYVVNMLRSPKQVVLESLSPKGKAKKPGSPPPEEADGRGSSPFRKLTPAEVSTMTVRMCDNSLKHKLETREKLIRMYAPDNEKSKLDKDTMDAMVQRLYKAP
eukprot:PhF_6_TR11014/c0_g1_i1/m.17836